MWQFLHLLTLFTMAWWAVAPIAPAHAEDRAPVKIILFDSSGSMWGKFPQSDKPKFKTVADALAPHFKSLLPSTPIGLYTFGQRCSGARVVVPPKAGVAADVIRRINRLNPKSKGPISLALRKMSQSLEPNSKGTVVLIHDGPDNCRQNPCLAADDVAKRHPNLVINLISINTPDDIQRQMQCVAKKTGGKLFSARTPAELAKAAKLALRTHAGDPDKSKPNAVATKTVPASDENIGPPGLKLAASLSQNSAPLNTPIVWNIEGASGAPDVKAVKIASEAATLIRRLAPGAYTVTASVGLTRVSQAVTVPKQGTKYIKVPLNSGEIQFRATDQNSSGFITVKPLADTAKAATKSAWLTHEGATRLIAPVGQYKVTFEDGLLRSDSLVDVALGKTAQTNTGSSSGRLRLAATLPNGQPLPGVSFHIREDDPSAGSRGKNVLRTRAPTPTIQLPAGTYVVSARGAHSQLSKRVVVTPASDLTETFTFRVGTLNLSTKRLGSALQSDLPFVFIISKINSGEAKEIVRSSEPTPKFSLPVGRYSISVELGSGNVKTIKTIEITADTTQAFELEIDAAQLILQRKETKGKRVYRDVLWEVTDAKGHVIWRTNQLSPETLLAPGTYTVVKESRRGISKQTVTLNSGEKKVLLFAR